MAYFAGTWGYFRDSMPLHPLVYVPLPETYPSRLPGLYLKMRYLLIHDKLVDRAFRNVEIRGKTPLIENGVFTGALSAAGDHGLEHFQNRGCYCLVSFRRYVVSLDLHRAAALCSCRFQIAIHAPMQWHTVTLSDCPSGNLISDFQIRKKMTGNVQTYPGIFRIPAYGVLLGYFAFKLVHWLAFFSWPLTWITKVPETAWSRFKFKVASIIDWAALSRTLS